MADSKIEDLTELTTVADTDVIAIVDDPAGTPLTKKITKANLVKNISNSAISNGALIDYSKLATLTDGNILVGNGSNVAVSVNPSGDIDVSNAGVFSIASGVILNADVNASANIAYSKLNLTSAILNADLAGSVSPSKITGTSAILSNNTFTGNQLMGARHQYKKGADVASAGGLTLGADGNIFDITGTTTINTITPTNWQAGSVVILQFDGILQVTHNSGGTNDIILGDATNYTTAVGDSLMVWFDGTDWREMARSAGVGGGGGASLFHVYSNSTITSYAGQTGEAQTIGTLATDGTNGIGLGDRDIYIRKIDANNEGVFTVVHKNGSLVEVQIA